MNNTNHKLRKATFGVTALELVIVVMIIGILAVMAVGVYDRQVDRARYAVARSEIKEISNAIHRYAADTGSFPVSSSGVGSAVATPLLQITPYFGNGFLYMSLNRSMSNNPTQPLSARWQGPYMAFADRKVQLVNFNIQGAGQSEQMMFLDPWANPYHYIGSNPNFNGSPISEYQLGQATELEPGHPFSGFESYYNPLTFQLFSYGRNGTTFNAPMLGLETDDITNFEGRLVETGIL